jgi:hypothetical protein
MPSYTYLIFEGESRQLIASSGPFHPTDLQGRLSG